jgi:hypothetical protein
MIQWPYRIIHVQSWCRLPSQLGYGPKMLMDSRLLDLVGNNAIEGGKSKEPSIKHQAREHARQEEGCRPVGRKGCRRRET